MARAHVDPEAWAKKVRLRKMIFIPLAIVLVLAFGTFWVLKKHVLPEQRRRKLYEQAEAALSQGDTQHAIDCFSLDWGYRDAAERATELAFSVQPDDSFLQVIQNAQLGEIVTFGSWEQDAKESDGPEPIEWIVLAEDDRRILLWSEKVLDTVPYNQSRVDITWANCTLRSWLNETFYQNAFSQNEKALISKTLIETADNPVSHTDGGADTEDSVFILSFNELLAFSSCNPNLNDVAALATDYATACGLDVHKQWRTCQWWLRMPGATQDCAGYCDMGGNPLYSGSVSRPDFGVRPAIWVFAPGRGEQTEN